MYLRRLVCETLESRHLLSTNVLHVDIDSLAPVPDGTSWPTAYVSLQAALDRAAVLNADGNAENDVAQIWIAEGTYRPTKLSDADGIGGIDTDPRSATFSLLNGVSLYGGFAGTEATLDEREPAIGGVFAHATILSGDLGQNDAPNIATADLLTDLNRQENAYTVVIARNRTQSTTLDGLTISGGNANVPGAIYSIPNGYGGGIHNSGSGTLTITSSTISGNSAKYSGGGIYSLGRLTVSGSIISDNSAALGGGIYSDFSTTLTVGSSIILGNSGHGIYSLGTATIINSTISDNSTNGDGGGIYNYDGTLTVTSSTISDNSASGYGGGIGNFGTTTVTSSTISGNSGYYGGGIYNATAGMLTVTNSTISGNSADGETGWGGGIFNYGTLTVSTSTISDNSADYGGGIADKYTHHFNLGGSIVAKNTARIYPDVSGSPTDPCPYNLIGIMWGSLPGWNNLIGTPSAPLDPRLGPLGDYGGPTWTMPLLPGSPAIDAGYAGMSDPAATDQRGSKRLVDGNYDGAAQADIGAFEFMPEKNLVLAWHVFYNHSSLDGDDPSASAADAAAIALDKKPLMPWQTATFANYTSYDKGINGIMVDLAALPAASLTTMDFEFLVGNGNDLAAWSPAPAPQSIDIFPGMGQDGSNRVTIIWSDGAIKNQWLRAVVKSNANTHLLEDDVVYFGNAVGESGNAAGNAIVNATDEIMARNFLHGPLNLATVDDPCDYNRDGLVNATDQIIARSHQTNPLSMLRLITAPTAINELIQNGGFEKGDHSGWTAASYGSPPMDDWTVGPAGGGFFFDSTPHGGNYSAYNGFDGPADQRYMLAQDVTIPVDVASATLVTHHRIRFSAGNLAAQKRLFRIEIFSHSYDMIYEERVRMTAPGTDFGWIRREFDLSAYAGHSIRIQFTEIIPDSYTGPAILELDDISLTYTVAPPAGAKSLEVPEASPAELNWLYELQQMNTRTAKRASPTEVAVDALLATYW